MIVKHRMFDSYSENIKKYAACIELVNLDHGSDLGPENDLYWHTRELCVQKVRESGGSIIDLFTCLRLIPMTGFYKVDRRNLMRIAGDVWFEVVHPSILVRDVLSE